MYGTPSITVCCVHVRQKEQQRPFQVAVDMSGALALLALAGWLLLVGVTAPAAAAGFIAPVFRANESGYFCIKVNEEDEEERTKR